MKILFLVPYPLKQAPSQRFRFEQYLKKMEQSGALIKIESFLLSQNWLVFFDVGNFPGKLAALFHGFFRRALTLLTATKYDFVFIHREAAPIGPPIIEWILARILKKKIIYDFDDAIWMTDKKNENWLEEKIRWRKKIASICRWSYKVSCGNEYLCAYARQFNDRVILNPTTIDTAAVHNRQLYPGVLNKKESQSEIIIGWTGSHSTLKYLDDLTAVLRQMETQHENTSLLVIANRQPEFLIERVIFKPWSVGTEIIDLLEVDIGIMPLPDDVWARGKCGFKALQYMALGIPTLASPVGVNSTIIQHGVNGFLCSTASEWVESLNLLIGDPALQKKIGEAGRQTVEKYYSVVSNSANFFSLFS